MSLVIIGNSAAGVAVAEAYREAGGKGDITIVGDEPHPVYSRCLIPEVVAGTAEPEAILFRPPGFYDRLGVKTILGRRAVQIEPGSRRVFLADGQSLSYDQLVLATGARPVPAGVAGETLPGIFPLRTLADALALSEGAKRSEAAVIIGGGLVALKAATALLKSGVPRVTVVVKSAHLLSRQLTPEPARRLQEVLEAMGLIFSFGQNPLIFHGEKQVRGVELEDGSFLRADLVVVGKGVVPNLELAREAGASTRRGILVNQVLETSLPNVHAAGDVAEVVDPSTGRGQISALWVTAVEQGRFLGARLAGATVGQVSAALAMNSVQFGELPILSIGRQEPGPDGYSLSHYDRRRGAYRRLVFEKDKLVGAILIGNIERGGLYTSLIRSGRPVFDEEELLLGSPHRAGNWYGA